MSAPDPDSAAGLLRQLAQSLRWQEELGAFGLTLPAPAAPAASAVPAALGPRSQTRPEPPPRSVAPAARPLPTSAPEAPASAPVAAASGATPSLALAPAPGPPSGPVSSPSSLAPIAEPTAADGHGAAGLERIRADLGPCTRCGLWQGRTNIVFGVGNPEADLMLIGEAPGFHEDQQGEPFVGRAGELLDRMIGAMGLRRSDLYIANIVKCRPPDNRDPEDEEILACEPFLLRQIRAVQPRVIVALGSISARTLLRTRAGITRLRGRWHDYHGVRLMPTFHPAFLLRRPENKREAWADLQLVMAELGLGAASR